MQNRTIKELFNFRLRVSPRARNIRLRVTLQHGLEVIIPRGYNRENIPDLLERKKHWIHTALEHAEANRKFFEPKPTWQIPHQIKLVAINKLWYVESKETDVPWVAVRETGTDKLLVFGSITNENTCREAFARWLMRRTREQLVPRLQTVSLKTRLRYQRVCIKRQRTRWASCSKRRTISLNMKLLFLPPEVVDYVLIHELCHVVEMNHSKKFWELVQHHCPDYRKYDKHLREMWKLIPHGV